MAGSSCTRIKNTGAEKILRMGVDKGKIFDYMKVSPCDKKSKNDKQVSLKPWEKSVFLSLYYHFMTINHLMILLGVTS